MVLATRPAGSLPRAASQLDVLEAGLVPRLTLHVQIPVQWNLEARMSLRVVAIIPAKPDRVNEVSQIMDIGPQG